MICHKLYRSSLLSPRNISRLTLYLKILGVPSAAPAPANDVKSLFIATISNLYFTCLSSTLFRDFVEMVCCVTASCGLR